MKKVVVVITILCLVLSFSFADDNRGINKHKRFEIITNDSGIEVLLDHETNETLFKVFRSDSNGNVIEVSFDEYVSRMSNAVKLEKNNKIYSSSNLGENDNLHLSKKYEPLQAGSFLVQEEFIKTSETYAYGYPEKVTPTVQGPCDLMFTQGISMSNSFSASFSLSSAMKTSIKASANFSWITSTTSITSNSTRYNIPAGCDGYVTFSPKYNVINGYVNSRSFGLNGWSSWARLGTVNALSPAVLSSGLGDGYIRVVLN